MQSPRRRTAPSPLAVAALLALATAGSAAAQIDLVDDDFEGVPVGTALDLVPGWSDLVFGFDTFTGRDPGDPASNAVHVTSSFAARALQTLAPLPSRYQIAFEVTVRGEGRFRVVCPTILVGMQIVDDSRFVLFFQGDASPPRVTYGPTGATALLPAGAPVRVLIDVDTSESAVVHVDGAVIGVTPWSTYPSACVTPVDLFWENNVLGDPGMFIDDVGVGTVADVGGCAPTPNSTGAAATLSGPALARLDRGGVRFVTRGLPPGATSVLALSRSTAPPAPLGDGRLCLGAPLARLAGTAAVAGAGGVASQGFDDRSVLPAPHSAPGAPAQVMAGETWFFQGWYRDAASPAGANLTSAVAVTFAP